MLLVEECNGKQVTECPACERFRRVRLFCERGGRYGLLAGCIEFFVKEPDSPYYFNFETNCIGAGLAAKRLSRGEFTHFDEARMAQVIRRSSFPPEPVDIHGKTAWSLELGIPFSLICEGAGVPSRLLANFYKCGDKTAVMHFLSWNPVRVPNPDFHRPEFFGELILKP